MSYQSTVEGTAGLVALYTMGHAEGANEPNIIGAGEAVPSAGGLTRVQPSILPTGEGVSTKFNGTTGFFGIATVPALEIADTVTFECWAKPIIVGTERVLFSLGVNSGGLALQGAGGKFLASKTGIAGYVFSQVVVSEAAHHILISKEGANRRVVLDGKDVTQLVTNQLLETSALEKFIGKYSGGLFYSGFMQFMAVYNVAVPLATAEEHYKIGSEIPVVPVPVESGFLYNSKKAS